MKRIVIITGFICLVFLVTGGLTGCGCREKASTKVAEKMMEHSIKAQAKKEGKDVDVNVDLSKNAMSIKSKEGDKDVAVNMKDGKVSIKTQEGDKKETIEGDANSMKMTTAEGTTVMTMGENAKIPENFPKDIPMYVGITVTTSTAMTDKEMFNVQATSPDAMDKVSAFYKQEIPAKGWKEEQIVSQSGDDPMQMMTYKKEDRSLMIMVSKDSEKTLLSVQTGKE